MQKSLSHANQIGLLTTHLLITFSNRCKNYAFKHYFCPKLHYLIDDKILHPDTFGLLVYVS